MAARERRLAVCRRDWSGEQVWGSVPRAGAELGRRWLPILDKFDACGIDLCYELHAGEDLHDGVSYERFLTEVNDHPAPRRLAMPRSRRRLAMLLNPLAELRY